jgi:hypothetical protein
MNILGWSLLLVGVFLTAVAPVLTERGSRKRRTTAITVTVLLLAGLAALAGNAIQGRQTVEEITGEARSQALGVRGEVRAEHDRTRRAVREGSVHTANIVRDAARSTQDRIEQESQRTRTTVTEQARQSREQLQRIAEEQRRRSERQELESRLTEARTQLTAGAELTRSHGVRALENLARDFPESRPDILVELTHFVRSRGEVERRSGGPAGADAVAAVQALGRLWKAADAGAQPGTSADELDLSGAYLSRADLRRTHLRGALLIEADLTDANLYGAELADADLYRADLTRADVSIASFDRANLMWADLSRVRATGTTFAGTIMRGTDLSGSGVRPSQLTSAWLDRRKTIPPSDPPPEGWSELFQGIRVDTTLPERFKKYENAWR